MKGNKIDDLFRNGLESHKISPPSTAWDKVESQLPKQSKKGIYFWISIAATILLVFAFGWIALNSQSDSQKADDKLQTAQNEPKKAVLTPAEQKQQAQAEIINPITPKKDLVAGSTETMKMTPSVTVPSKSINHTAIKSTEKLANIEVQDSPVEAEQPPMIIIDLEHILPATAKTPKFFVVEQVVKEDFVKDFSVDIEVFVASHYIMTEEPTKRKRFSLLNGIVSVAKGVNNGKLAFSEMRKSKNDFFNNDLKYGSKESESEDIEDDLDEK